MHSIKEKPVVVDGQIVIRPIMVVALTYDHRMLDGREAVTFLGEQTGEEGGWLDLMTLNSADEGVPWKTRRRCYYFERGRVILPIDIAVY
jgi:hypothetical protein